MIDYGRTDIDISCRVNGTSLNSIEIIQLKRSDTNIVSVLDGGLSYQDKQLETRSKANGSIKNVLMSYLQLKIMACDVNQTIDERTYQCTLIAIGNKTSSAPKFSDEVNLNITGNNLNVAHLFVIRFANSCVTCSIYLKHSLKSL